MQTKNEDDLLDYLAEILVVAFLEKNRICIGRVA